VLTRRRLFVAAAAVGSAALAACGAPAAPPPRGAPGARPVTLRWAVRGGAPEARGTLLAAYRARRPDVTVEQLDVSGGVAASLDKIAAAIAAGQAVDFLSGHLAARQLVEAVDAIQPVDDLARRDKLDLDRYNRAALDAVGRHDGKLHALPYAYGGDVVAVAYNRRLFREAGVAEPPSDWAKPWTWDEFREAARRTTRGDGSQVGLAGVGFWLHSLPLQWGAHWLADDQRTVTCDSPEMVDAITRLSDLILVDRATGLSPGVTTGSDDEAFLRGKAAVVLPCCHAPRFARSTVGTGVEWAFTTMPKGTVSSLDVSPVVMGLAKASRERDEAWELMKFMDDGSRLAAAEERAPAVLPDVPAWVKRSFAEFPDAHAEMLVEGMRVARPLEPLRYHPRWQTMSAEVLEPAWQEVMERKRTAPEMLRAVKPRLQAIVDDHARARGK
jgi:ABC-type glycerol-3-phosphate transport system substrate-binding protein